MSPDVKAAFRDTPHPPQSVRGVPVRVEESGLGQQAAANVLRKLSFCYGCSCDFCVVTGSLSSFVTPDHRGVLHGRSHGPPPGMSLPP